MWVAPARISAKTLRDANQFMFSRLRYRTLSTKDEAQLNCVRFVRNSMMRWRGDLSKVKMNAQNRRP